MGPGAFVAEGGAVQAGVQDPPGAAVITADLGGEADDRSGAVAQHRGGQTVCPHPTREHLNDGVVGVDTSPAGDTNQRLGQFAYGVLVLPGGRQFTSMVEVVGTHDHTRSPRPGSLLGVRSTGSVRIPCTGASMSA